MSRLLLLVILIAVSLPVPVLSGDGVDILQLVLDSAGFSHSDLGYQPKGYWSRFPLDIPYRLTSFDDLFREPLKLYDYSKTMAGSVAKYHDSSFLDSSSLGLYYLTYSLGVDRKLGGFRNYSPNLISVTDSTYPLAEAIDSLFKAAREDPLVPRQFYYQPLTQDYLRLNADLAALSDSDTVDVVGEYKSKAKSYDMKMPIYEKLILGKLILNLIEAAKWRRIALRNCDRDEMERILKIDDLALTQSDGNIYYPEYDDIAGSIDMASMHYAALKAAAIVQETADSIIYYKDSVEFIDFYLPTPYGRIVLAGSGKGQLDDYGIGTGLATIDLGDVEETGAVGATGYLDIPISVHIDLAGDDIYYQHKSGYFTSLGGGVLGVGILYEAAGNDVYIGKNNSQGFGVFGVGILFDREGDDKYRAELSGQGCGYFGIGLCLDGGGNDSFYIYGAGQGYGGIGGGIGVLADYMGDDFYEGEPSPEVYDLSDYHSEKKINGNGVQGVGFGRRGDITDGHSWAGGLGAIIDIGGNDHYLSGNWSLGTAYWFSTGIAYDGSGNDYYESCYFTQGSGAHFCNGIMIDEGGDDRHELYETAGAALGFGWDYANAFLYNIGGNDSYTAGMISMGCAEIRSNAFLIEIGGDDTYRLKEGALGLGAVDDRDYYRRPTQVVTYYSDSKSIGGLIDIGGNDRYISYTDSTEVAHPAAGNNRCWFKPEKSDSTFGANNIGVGTDVESGIIPELERWK
nr:hypothetical protein [candidate division Zixibacteria bacterium]